MALSTESANLVWQKVAIALDSLGANSYARDAFRALKAYTSQIGGNLNLQFVAISNLTADVVAADVACKVYGIFLKKQATATDAFYKAFNDAATDSSAEDALITIALTEASEQELFVCAAGKAFSAGVTHGSFTAATGAAGTTATTTGDGPNGFVIIGAA
jgi:hypothetical protein